MSNDDVITALQTRKRLAAILTACGWSEKEARKALAKIDAQVIAGELTVDYAYRAVREALLLGRFGTVYVPAQLKYALDDYDENAWSVELRTNSAAWDAATTEISAALGIDMERADRLLSRGVPSLISRHVEAIAETEAAS